ncbi:MAG: hypothetical protein KJ077_08310 [Anaerolineae bacterium]|nr:hypothetical protein [Anaerolineae bacterium]
MKISDLFPSKYMKGDDMGGKPWSFKIKSVRMEEMHDKQANKKAKKPVVYFHGPRKGLILNRTVAEQIAKVTDQDDTDNWPGHVVTIHPMTITAFGSTYLVIRVKPPENGPSEVPDELAHDEEELEEILED